MHWSLVLSALAGACRFGFDQVGTVSDGRANEDSVGDPCATVIACVADGCCPATCAGSDPDCPVCGDSVCVGIGGETCQACSECNTLAIVCGNDQCQVGEADGVCTRDCGPFPWPSAWLAEEAPLAAAVNLHRTMGTDCGATMNPPLSLLSSDPAVVTAARWLAWNWASSTHVTGSRCNGHTIDEIGNAAGVVGGFGGVVDCRAATSTAAEAADNYMTTALCQTIVMRADAVAIGTAYADDSGVRCWYTAFRY